MVKSLVARLQSRCRARRAAAFGRCLRPSPQDRILDLGSGDGSYMARILPWRENVCLADLSARALARARATYGFRTVVLEPDAPLPFPDAYFDIVHCNSVIEHVVCPHADARHFRRQSLLRQRQFAAEIQRVGKNWYVECPNRWFPLEAHTWLPFVQFLPREWLLAILPWLNRHWIKDTNGQWNLLDAQTMSELFPGAMILRERWLGLTKSVIAIGGQRVGATRVSPLARRMPPTLNPQHFRDVAQLPPTP